MIRPKNPLSKKTALTEIDKGVDESLKNAHPERCLCGRHEVCKAKSWFDEDCLFHILCLDDLGSEADQKDP